MIGYWLLLTFACAGAICGVPLIVYDNKGQDAPLPYERIIYSYDVCLQKSAEWLKPESGGINLSSVDCLPSPFLLDDRGGYLLDDAGAKLIADGVAAPDYEQATILLNAVGKISQHVIATYRKETQSYRIMVHAEPLPEGPANTSIVIQVNYAVNIARCSSTSSCTVDWPRAAMRTGSNDVGIYQNFVFPGKQIPFHFSLTKPLL